MKKTALFGALALALSMSVSAAELKLKELRVAIDPTYEPFTFKTPDGKPTGFDVEVAEALCAELKIKCVFVEQAWDGMIPGLKAKKYDAIVSSMSITEDRKRAVDFTGKYYNTPSRVVVKLGTAKDLPDLKGKRIGVLKASTQEAFAKGELTKLGANVVPYDAQDQVYLDLKAGRLDGTVADIVEVNKNWLAKPEGKGWGYIGPVLSDKKYFKYFGEGAGIAIRKGDTALKDALNKAIGAIRANGTWKKINDKYVPFDIWG
ncbi:transporter substrate-binding domain-containing protein [Chitinimonas sp. BJYL2]|uniref:transporter substrate-binding domain-containing protein n=1 Tax=Chitinimonas sp. BJYL2 TaxID=2976696 RepID=UPI0022B2DCD9|nr:transporter substrate-binding domain-containing protein [Chitinimonas sp. BJYL2]